jgi:thiol:disulfide interchange protein DsbC
MKLQQIAKALPVAFLLLSCAALADEAAIRKRVASKFPKTTLDSVTKMPFLGLYEVILNGELYYTDGDFKFLIDGSVIDVNAMANLTSKRHKELEQEQAKKSTFPFDQLPLDLAFKKVKGSGARKIAVFSDPDCPYCKRLENALAKIDDVTIYVFLLPLEGLHPNAPAVARSIWCADDKVKAWDDYMQHGVKPENAADCSNPVEEIGKYGQTKKINATPTLFFADGARVSGALPAEDIERTLKALEKK